jgi:Type II secretion system protein C
MKQPVWILNSSLLVLFCMSQLLLFMMQRVVPRRISISPGKMIVEQEQAVAHQVEIKNIYEHDLFGTYEPPVIPVQSVIEEVIAAIPNPPKMILPEVPVEKMPTFFAPLDVVLKGVIFVKDDPANCIAIVQLKKTKEERNYQVGDLIEDAQILKILSNRIIIIRSNGQQETLYLREEDAVSDFNKEAKSIPKSVVENSSGNKYIINIDEFTKRIRNLGEFINLLDLTTVYKHGKSFGCRVGKIDKDSLGFMLGLMVDDIIVKIDNYFIDDLANRIQVYDHIIQKHVGEVIEVVLYRGQDSMMLQYGLIDNVSKNVVFTPQQTHKKLLEELSKHEAQYVSADQQVVIQNISYPDEMMDAPGGDVSNGDALSFDEALLQNNDIVQPKVQPIQNKSISRQIQQAQTKTVADSQKKSGFDKDQQRLIQERDKLAPTLRNMKSKDKNNMMKRSSRNVIFDRMQQ